MTRVTRIICPNSDCYKSIPRFANFCPYCGHDTTLNNDKPTDDRRYFITRIIKKGGQGAVYEGIDQDERIYAIKEMLDTFSDPDERSEAVERFNAEASLLQKLSHPRIPRVYSHFTDEGRHYLTMDFIHGRDLEQIIEHDGPIPESQVLIWADQICDVLEFLHSKGLIYRDMKPSNVMIEAADGNVKLIDFGIAKVFKATERRGTQIGTPGYAPPEQYQGLATIVSDIYSLSATLHHALTGRDPTQHAPFTFPPAHEIQPHISPRVSNALAQALQMRPEDRIGTVAEFRALLQPPSATPDVQIRVTPKQPVAMPGLTAAQVVVPPIAQLAPMLPGSSSSPTAGGTVAQARSAMQRWRAFWISACMWGALVLLALAIMLFFQIPGVMGWYMPEWDRQTSTPQSQLVLPIGWFVAQRLCSMVAVYTHSGEKGSISSNPIQIDWHSGLSLDEACSRFELGHFLFTSHVQNLRGGSFADRVALPAPRRDDRSAPHVMFVADM